MDERSQALSLFLAGDLLARTLSRGADAPGESRFHGAVIVVDISGSTRLADRLCRTGAQGVEEFRTLIGTAFARYVDTVYEFGGYVACFAGDALIAYWPAAKNALANAVADAIACASRLQQIARDDAGSRVVTPDIHIGVGAGALWAARLGGVAGRWKLLLGGDAVREATAAEVEACECETRLGATALHWFNSNTAPDHEPAPRCLAPSSVPLLESTDLSAFVPRVVVKRCIDTEPGWDGELREICSLQIHIHGLDDNSPDALLRHNEAVRGILAALSRYSGSAGDFLLDDKGLVFKVTFGLPLDYSHIDDSQRAALAGLAIIDNLTRQGLQCAAGIANGVGLCGAIGGRARREYVVVSASMPLASRLAQTQQPGVYCTEGVSERLDASFQRSIHDKARLKGFADTVTVYKLNQASIGTRKPPLVGRHQELQVLHDRIAQLKSGSKSVITIVGDAGIGKTALVRTFVEQIDDQDISVLFSGGQSAEYATSFLSWRDVFLGLLGLGPDADLHVLLARVRQRWQRRLSHPEWLPLLNAVLPLGLENNAFTRSLTRDSRVKIIAALLREILEVEAERPLLIVLEDCHWMDSVSLRLVDVVARHIPNVMLVLTLRPAAELEGLALDTLPYHTRIELQGLPPASVAQVVSRILGAKPIHPRVLSVIEEQSRGNPFLVNEYAAALRQNDLVVQGDAQWTLREHVLEDSTVTLSVTAEHLIGSRLDELSVHEVLALKAAAVIGRSFAIPLLVETYPDAVDTDQLQAIVEHLCRHRILVRDETSSSSYAFAHYLIRQSVYNLTLFAQRRTLHRAVAAAIEKLHAPQLHSHYAALAHHWHAGETPAAAVRYASLAADSALDSGGYREARQLLLRCLDYTELRKEVSSDRTQRMRWHRRLADTYRGLGDQDSVASEASKVLSLGGQPKPRSRTRKLLGIAALLISRSAQRSGNETVAREMTKAHRHSTYAAIFFSPDPIDTVYHSVNALKYARGLRPGPDLAGAYAELGGFLGVAGVRPAAWRLLHKSVDVARLIHEPGGLAHVHMANSLYAVGAGSWDQAVTHANACQEFSLQIGDHVNWCNAQALRFWSSLYQGDDKDAADLAAQLLEGARKAGNRQQEAWGLRFQALVDIRAGNPARALERLLDCLRCLGSTRATSELVPTIGLQALAHRMLNDHDSALTQAHVALKLMNDIRHPIIHSLLEGFSAVTEVILNDWTPRTGSPADTEHAVQCLLALKRYQRTFPIGAPRYRLWQARYQRKLGHHAGSRRALQRGLAAARELAMRTDEHWILEESRIAAGPRTLDSAG